MGIDASICLPDKVRLQDVADVLGILLGCEKSLKPLGPDGQHCEVKGVRTSNFDGVALPASAQILVDLPDGTNRWFHYHFEFSHGHGLDERFGRGIMLRSYGENIALLVGLADFFGGVVDFDDSDDDYADYAQPERPDIRASDGQEWDDFQVRIASVEPLTFADCRRFASKAAYRARR